MWRTPSALRLTAALSISRREACKRWGLDSPVTSFCATAGQPLASEFSNSARRMQCFCIERLVTRLLSHRSASLSPHVRPRQSTPRPPGPAQPFLQPARPPSNSVPHPEPSPHPPRPTPHLPAPVSHPIPHPRILHPHRRPLHLTQPTCSTRPRRPTLARLLSLSAQRPRPLA